MARTMLAINVSITSSSEIQSPKSWRFQFQIDRINRDVSNYLIAILKINRILLVNSTTFADVLQVPAVLSEFLSNVYMHQNSSQQISSFWGDEQVLNAILGHGNQEHTSCRPQSIPRFLSLFM